MAFMAWFTHLSPYKKPGSILQMEDVNYAPGSDEEIVPLFAWAISDKRYALFNIAGDGLPIIRKASAHVLDQWLSSYSQDDPAPGVPDPMKDLRSMGIHRWKYDFWSAFNGAPDQVLLNFAPCERDAAKLAELVFDRETGKPVLISALKTLCRCACSLSPQPGRQVRKWRAG